MNRHLKHFAPKQAGKWALAGFAGTLALFAGMQGHAQAIAGHNSNASVSYACLLYTSPSPRD